MWGTLIVGAVVAAIISLAIRKLYTDRKSGKGCGGNCSGCSACPGGMSKQGEIPDRHGK